MRPAIDPRRGDIEDDASSSKRRSLLSLAGSLLAEISLPKLAIAWILLIGLPGVMLGVAPLVISLWFRLAHGRTADRLLALSVLSCCPYPFGRRKINSSGFWRTKSVMSADNELQQVCGISAGNEICIANPHERRRSFQRLYMQHICGVDDHPRRRGPRS